MRNPIVWGILAVAIGLGAAATALYTLKPMDKPLSIPGGIVSDAPLSDTAQKILEPPAMITIGDPSAPIMMHVVLGDDRVANKNAYDMAAKIISESVPGRAMNIIPVITPQTPLYKAFSWAIAAGKNPEAQQGFVESLMGTTGAITTQVLSVIAQNNALGTTELQAEADKPTTKEKMEQARDVSPPALPAIYINGAWLSGDTLNETVLREAAGDTVQSDNNTALLVVSDAYAFATPPKPKVGAIFMTLKNVGQSPASIMGAVSSAAGRIEIHGHAIDDKGVMQMRAQPSLDVKPAETVTLKPAGLHLMLYDLPAPLVVGQRVPLTLQLKGGSEISTLVIVTPPGEVLTPTP